MDLCYIRILKGIPPHTDKLLFQLFNVDGLLATRNSQQEECDSQ